MTHRPWTSISTRSSSGERIPRPSTRHKEAIFASSRLPFSAGRAYPKITSACPLSPVDHARQCLILPTFRYSWRSFFLLLSFKPNPNSSVTTFVDEKTGEEKERLINKGRWKGFGPTSVSFFEKAVGEPLLR